MHFGKKLVDNTVSNSGSVVGRPSLLEYCVQFIENNDVKPAFVLFLLVLVMNASLSGDFMEENMLTHFFFGVCEQFSNVLLGCTDKLA